VQALLAWLAAVRLTAGFVSGHVAEDLEVPGAYLFSSAWRTREDMDAHMLGPDFGVLLGALDVLGHDTRLLVTAATEGEEDGWVHVRELRGRTRLLHEEAAHVLAHPSSQQSGVEPS
jgi:quinol monooxygenase YgiN